MNHALILPILLPAVVGAVLVIAARYDRVLARVLSLASMVLMLAIALGLFVLASRQPVGIARQKPGGRLAQPRHPAPCRRGEQGTAGTPEPCPGSTHGRRRRRLGRVLILPAPLLDCPGRQRPVIKQGKPGPLLAHQARHPN